MLLSFKVKKDPELVFDYLTQMQKFVSIHPVISKMEEKGNDACLVHETLKFGFVPFSFTYPVSIKKDLTKKTVSYSATIFRLTHIEIRFEIKTNGEFTLIEETVQFRSLWPVKYLVANIFRKQHSLLFKNLEDA